MTKQDGIVVSRDDVFKIHEYLKNHPTIVIGVGLSITIVGVGILIDNKMNNQNNYKGAN